MEWGKDIMVVSLVDATAVQQADMRVGEDDIPRLLPYVRSLAAMCMKMDILGLAASQVGMKERFFVFRRQPFSFLTAFNPVLTAVKRSGRSVSAEGCLHAPNRVFEIERWNEVKILYNRFTDEGKFKMEQDRVSGQLAFAVQHAMDCLDGKPVSLHGKEIVVDMSRTEVIDG